MCLLVCIIFYVGRSFVKPQRFRFHGRGSTCNVHPRRGSLRLSVGWHARTVVAACKIVFLLFIFSFPACFEKGKGWGRLRRVSHSCMEDSIRSGYRTGRMYAHKPAPKLKIIAFCMLGFGENPISICEGGTFPRLIVS